MEETNNFMDKKLDSLTVGDAFKLNAGIMAISLAPVGIMIVAGVVSEKVSNFRAKRQRENTVELVKE